MKILYLLLIPAILLTTTTFAQNGTYEESVYVVSTQNKRPVDDLAIDCAWASQLSVLPIAGSTSDLYSVQSKKTTGVLLKDNIKKVGELLSCFDIGSDQVERGIIPTYDFGQAWLLTLDGQQYIVTGMTRMRTNPAQPFLGILGTILVVSTGTIYTPESIVLNPPVPVGSFSTNGIVNLFLLPGPTGGILTIRLYSPTGNGD